MKKNKGSGGIDGVTIEMFEKNLNRNLREIQRRLQENRYKPDPVRRHYIEKENGKLRPLGIPTIRERVCQQAVRQIIESIFEQDLRERITDGRVLTLIRSWLTAGVMEDDQFHETKVGSPQEGLCEVVHYAK